MKTKFKMAVSLILSAIVIFSSMAIGGMFASADDAVTYDFDSSTGVLTISGTGEVTKSGVLAKVPDRNTLKGVVINEGITSIGESAFEDFASLTTEIGDYAFAYCVNLKKINLPKSFEVIPEGMFCGSGIKNITIPSNITTIGESAFYDCENLKYVFYASSQEDWNNIVISPKENDSLTEATIHYNATGHTFDTESKCTVEGCDYFCDHTDNTNKFICTEDYICSVCKKKLSSATTHSFDANGKCTKSECGYVCDHADNTNKATCEKSAVCSKCGATLAALGHDFSGSPTETKATFFKDGSKVYHCTHDGCTETRTEITLSTINRILAWFKNIFSFKF